jgi:hypothetical protein
VLQITEDHVVTHAARRCRWHREQF